MSAFQSHEPKMTEKTRNQPTLRPETLTAQGLGHIAEPYRDIVEPIHLATTYARDRNGELVGGRLYARDANPAYDQPEALLARLENGWEAVLLPSGMAAAQALLQLLKPGERLVVPRSMYWALRSWVRHYTAHLGITLAEYDNASLDSLRAALAGKPTRLLWIETPANPTWDVTDIAAASALGHAVGARVVVDSTVATPVLSRPLELGADYVMHSATKYLNGHSDVIAGAVVAREDSEDWQAIRRHRNQGGAILGGFEAWLLLRGMRTLFPRVRLASRSAQAIAEWLSTHPQVIEVRYPGLPGDPNHQVAARQMAGGFGGMLSIRVQGGHAGARRFAGALQVFREATSLGSVESLVEHRAPVEGPGTLCPDDLLRLSIGIEAVEDLIADLAQALDGLHHPPEEYDES